MLKLETEFYSKGYIHKLVKRAQFTAVYARFRRSDPQMVVHYEVIVISPGKPYHIAGIDFPAKELYPCSEQWGLKGWTYRAEAEAFAKFQSLLARDRKIALCEIAN